MSMKNQSTLQLRKRKEEIDAAATFGAVNVDVPESMYSDLQQLENELRERQQAYERHCKENAVDSVINDWAFVSTAKTWQEVADHLAVGWEKSGAKRILNPKNLYFEEIEVEFDGDSEKIKSVTFVMRCALTKEWIDEKSGKLDRTKIEFEFVEDAKGESVLRAVRVVV
jgi:hypothetical protein